MHKKNTSKDCDNRDNNNNNNNNNSKKEKKKMKRLWNCKEVVLVPIVVGALGTFSKRFNLYLKKAGLDGSILPLQKACLLGTARIIRKVMDT